MEYIEIGTSHKLNFLKSLIRSNNFSQHQTTNLTPIKLILRSISYLQTLFNTFFHYKIMISHMNNKF